MGLRKKKRNKNISTRHSYIKRSRTEDKILMNQPPKQAETLDNQADAESSPPLLPGQLSVAEPTTIPSFSRYYGTNSLGAGYSPYSQYPSLVSPYGGSIGAYGTYGMDPAYLKSSSSWQTGALTESTRTTFQLLENLVGTISGIAQMLESSYFATYNSFFTLMSFAEQLSRLRDILSADPSRGHSGIFSFFNVFKLIRRLLLGGRWSQNQERNGGNEFLEEFNEYRRGNNKNKNRGKLAWRPLLIFSVCVLAFPLVMNRLMKRLNEANSRSSAETGLLDPDRLEFARAVYKFVPENPRIEVALDKGDLMAILSKKDAFGNESQWWKVRTKGGSIGYVPSNYIEIIKRSKKGGQTT